MLNFIQVLTMVTPREKRIGFKKIKGKKEKPSKFSKYSKIQVLWSQNNERFYKLLTISNFQLDLQ